MAVPSWITFAPRQHTASGGDVDNTRFSLGIHINPDQSNRSGTITLVGSVGQRTITRTISVLQHWAACLRIIYTSKSNVSKLYHEKSDVSDLSLINSNLLEAETLRICYPYLGGSNVRNYSCRKENGVFYFELNKIHIDIESDLGETIHSDYWDVANALFTKIPGSNTQFLYTPVINFSYNPSSNEVTVLNTLYSKGGAIFIIQFGPGAVPPHVPQKELLIHTAEVGNESNGIGAIYAQFLNSNNDESIYYPFVAWWPRIIKRTVNGGVVLLAQLEARSLGSDIYTPDITINSAELSDFGWTISNQYIRFLVTDGVALNYVSAGQMGTFYNQSIYEEINN